MSLKVNFFPLHFIIAVLGLVVFSTVFSDTIYVYMAENIVLNGAIIALFIFCMIWIFGCLSYYSRSVKLINNMFNSAMPSEPNGEEGGNSMYVASTISGTLIDNPIASKVLSNFVKTGKLDISYSDALIIVEAVESNGDRVLGPAKFLAGVFILLGLFGTFIGLLHTIDGVGTALKSVSDADNVDVFGLVGLLVEPLQGMGMAFSASLFGLTAGLYANYGVFVSQQQLAVFVNKLKNFLTATTGMSAVDPAEIKAEDILLALEDSFNKLSVVFAEKLDMVTEGLLAMSKVIARGQDRQEKLSKASLINLVKLVELADKLNILESLDENLRQGLEENRIELFKYLDDKVVGSFNLLLDSMELSNRISTDHVEISEKSSVVVEDIAGMMENLVGLTEASNDIISEKSDAINSSLKSNGDILNDLLDSSDESLTVLELIEGKTTGIDYRPNFDEVVNVVLENNDLTTETNALSDEANNLADTLINKVATEDSLLSTIDSVKDVNAAVDDTISELEAHRDILNETLDSLNDIGNAVDDNLIKITDVNEGILSELTDANSLHQDVLNEVIRSNELSEDILSVGNDSLDTARDILAIDSEALDVSKDHLDVSRDSLDTTRDILATDIEALDVSKDHLDVSRDSLDTTRDILAIDSEALDVSKDHLDVSRDSLDTTRDILAIDSEALDVSKDHLDVSRDSLDTTRDILATDIEALDVSKDSLTSLVASEGILSSVDRSLTSSVELMERWYDLSNAGLDEIISLKNSLDYFGETLSLNNDYLSTIITISEDSLTKLSSIDEVVSEQLPVIYNLERYSDSILTNLEQLNTSSIALNSRIDEITDGFSMYLPLMTDVMGVVRDEMNALNDTVLVLGNNIYEMAEGLRYHGDAIGRFGEIVSTLDLRMENLSYSTEALNSSLEQMLPTMNEAISISSTNSQYLAQLIGTLDYIAQTAEGIGSSMIDFANTVLQENAYIAEQVQNVSEVVVSSTDRVAEVMFEATDRISNSLAETSNTIVDSASLIAQAAEQSAMISNDSSMAAQSMLSVVDEFSQLRDMYSSQMTEVSQLLSDTISSVLSATDYVSNNLIDLNNLVSQVENYSNDVMSTQEAIRDSVQGMLTVTEYISSSQDNFLSSLTNSLDNTASLISDSVNYTSSMLIDGVNSVIERLNNINMLTEVQTNKLDNLDYRLSELPETVTSMFMNLGDMFGNMQNYLGSSFENMQNLVYDIINQNSQAQSAIMEAVIDNKNANSMVMEMVNQTTGLQSVIADLANQSGYANNMVSDLALQTSGLQSSMDMLANTFSAQTDSLQSSMSMLVDNFAGIYSGVVDTSNVISSASDSLLSISNELSTQTDALERNSIIASNLSNDLQSLAFSNESLRDVGSVLANVTSSLENLSYALSTVQTSAENMDRTFANYSDVLFGEVSRLTETLSSHLNNFMSKDLSLGQDIYNIMNGISQTTNDISQAINTFESLASDSIISNREVRTQIENSMNYAISEIASIKQNLGNNISERIINEISQVSNNQYEMMNRLSSVLPQINDLINILSSNGGAYGQTNNSNSNIDLLNALMALREEHQNGNARLDIMANAVDTLITEILNSRDVAETILDVVTRIAGLTRN